MRRFFRARPNKPCEPDTTRTYINLAFAWGGSRGRRRPGTKEPLLTSVEVLDILAAIIIKEDSSIGDAVLELSALHNSEPIKVGIGKGNVAIRLDDKGHHVRSLTGQWPLGNAVSVGGVLPLVDTKFGGFGQWRAIGGKGLAGVTRITNVAVAETTVEMGNHNLGACALILEGGGKLHLGSRQTRLDVAIAFGIKTIELGVAKDVEDGIPAGVGAGALPLPGGLHEQTSVATVLEDDVGEVVRVDIRRSTERIAKVLKLVDVVLLHVVAIDTCNGDEPIVSQIVEPIPGLFVGGRGTAGDGIPPVAVDYHDADFLRDVGTVVVRLTLVLARVGSTLLGAATSEVLEFLLGNVAGANEGIVTVARSKRYRLSANALLILQLVLHAETRMAAIITIVSFIAASISSKRWWLLESLKTARKRLLGTIVVLTSCAYMSTSILTCAGQDRAMDLI